MIIERMKKILFAIATLCIASCNTSHEPTRSVAEGDSTRCDSTSHVLTETELNARRERLRNIDPDAKAKAAVLLATARQELANANYNEARDCILRIREEYPTAKESRSAGLLLLDSIEMIAARDSAQSATGEEWNRLSTKAKFFERKLEEDKKK